MTTWASLFERGSDYDADVAAVRDALAVRRSGADGSDE